MAASRAAETTTERGEVMRRGVYQSLVWRWGQQIDAGTLGTKRPGPPPTGKDKSKIRVREPKRSWSGPRTGTAPWRSWW